MNMVLKDSAPKRQADIPQAIDELSQAVSELDQEVGLLQASIQSVTRNEPCNEKDVPKAIRTSYCSVSNGVREQIERIRDITKRVQAHAEALEC